MFRAGSASKLFARAAMQLVEQGNSISTPM
ncbi:hypothetical protein BMIN10S_03853 [Bosea minatitlanensis]